MWIHGPRRDVCLALCWVPFAAAGLAVQHDSRLLAGLLSATLLLSLSHQPVTLALVYGDRERFDAHRRVYALGPVVAASVVLIALHVSFVLVALAAGLWNAEHTLMQRYGITRMYGRKAGDDLGGLEKPMLFSWLAAAVVATAANPRTPRYLAEVNVGDVNRQGIRLLTDLRSEAALLLVPALIVAAVLTARWWAAERALPRHNTGKLVYLGATAALIVMVCVDPVAGFAAYVGAHALEYFVIVHSAAGRRARNGEGGVVGTLIRTRIGAAGFVAIAAVVALVPLMIIGRWGTFMVATTVYLTVGALHIAYDGLIWKMRTPKVARDLQVFCASIPPSTTSTAPLM